MKPWQILFTFLFSTFLLPIEVRGSDSDSLLANANASAEGVNILVLISNNRNIYEEWKKPQTPQIKTAATYERGQHALPLIVYSFEPQVQKPYPLLSYNIAIFKPDTTVYAKFEKLSVFDGDPIEPQVLYLAKQRVDIGFEESDPLGIYRIDLVIFANGRHVMSFPNLRVELTD